MGIFKLSPHHNQKAMDTTEQQQVKMTYYNEVMQYMEYARKTLKKAGKDVRFYTDEKYVKTACGIAYNGVLKALNGHC